LEPKTSKNKKKRPPSTRKEGWKPKKKKGNHRTIPCIKKKMPLYKLVIIGDGGVGKKRTSQLFFLVAF
jgi:hypothetical protein